MTRALALIFAAPAPSPARVAALFALAAFCAGSGVTLILRALLAP